MKKNLLSLLLICVLALSLVSCTASEGGGSSQPAEQGGAQEDGGDPSIRFETVDLDGNAVSSEDVFAGHRLTMINIWGTYCGPCIGEMPDLEVLNTRLAEKDCAIIGVVCDVANADDNAVIGSAKGIIADTGVTYPSLVPWDGLWTDLPARFIPTTYFIDSEGHVLGDPAVGARGADDYEALIDALLEAME